MGCWRHILSRSSFLWLFCCEFDRSMTCHVVCIPLESKTFTFSFFVFFRRSYSFCNKPSQMCNIPWQTKLVAERMFASLEVEHLLYFQTKLSRRLRREENLIHVNVATMYALHLTYNPLCWLHPRLRHCCFLWYYLKFTSWNYVFDIEICSTDITSHNHLHYTVLCI